MDKVSSQAAQLPRLRVGKLWGKHTVYVAGSPQPSGDGGWTAAGTGCLCVRPHPAHQGKAEPHLLTLMVPLATGPESQPQTFLPHPPQRRDDSPPDVVNDGVMTNFAGAGWDREDPGAPFGDTWRH